MKSLIYFSIVSLFFTGSVQAQQTEGVVNYTYKKYWLKIVGHLTYLSREEKDRATQTWKNEEEENKGEKMKLTFNAKESMYTYGEPGSTEDGGYSWRASELKLYRNFETDKKVDVIETLGKTYIIEDSLHTPTWKIGNQIKEIAGYVCMRADTEDPIEKHKVTAWFAQDIPVPAGPERYNGLPGVILELSINDGDVMVEATSVTLKQVAPDALKIGKVKGKKINDATYSALIHQHIEDAMKAQRNPYWTIRY